MSRRRKFLPCPHCHSVHTTLTSYSDTGEYMARCLCCEAVLLSRQGYPVEADWQAGCVTLKPKPCGSWRKTAACAALADFDSWTVSEAVAESDLLVKARKICAEADQGGTDNNMPPSNHTEEPQDAKTTHLLEPASASNPHISGGIDWLELSVFCDLSEKWPRLEDEFARARDVAKETKEGEIIRPVEGKFFEVQAWGATIGKKSYPFRCFDNFELVWLFHCSPDYKKQTPTIRIRITGEQCLIHDSGVAGLIKHIKETLRGLGSNVIKLAVSRVDLCLDLAGISVETFKNAHFNQQFSTKSRSHSGHENSGDDAPDSIDRETWRYLKSNGYTFYYGRSPMQLRVYDKLAELQHKLKPRKWQAMINRRWGGHVPKAATRVEFEIRRERLKNYGIDTVEHLETRCAALVHKLSREWFRYTTKTTKGCRNAQRLETLPAWVMVQEGFDTVFKGNIDHDLTPIPKEECDVSALVKQALGVLLKCAECQGANHETYDDFAAYAVELMKRPAMAKRKEWDPLLVELDKAALM